MMLHPALVLTLQSSLWTCPLGGCHQQWSDVFVVLLLIEAVHLYHLHVLECHSLQFSVQAGCVGIIWLLQPCPCSCLYPQLMDFSWFLISFFFFFCLLLAHFLLFLFQPATTLEVSLLPTIIALCISCQTLLLWV